MSQQRPVPEATAYRLSLYHCYLGELLLSNPEARLTSRVLADELDLKEESVRRDISFIGNVGRPGAGYDAAELKAAIQEFLGLQDLYPVVRVGARVMLEALRVVFPAEAWGIQVVDYFSENPEDVGVQIDDIAIKDIAELPAAVQGRGVEVALVACAPPWVQVAIDLCHEAGIRGVLLMTPKLRINKPEGMKVTHVRMPCDIKSLACRCSPSARYLE